MKKNILILILLMSSFFIQGQGLSIEDCYKKAERNNPLYQNSQFIEASSQYNVSNAMKAWLPNISVSGKATYQSEVTEFPISLPGIDIPKLNKDQYNLTAEVSQTIFDGGAIGDNTRLIKAQQKVAEMQQEVSMYNIKENINQLFFGILVIDAQLKQNDILLKDLDRINNQVVAYMNNGMANSIDVQRVEVEKLNAKQNRTKLNQMRTTYLDILGKYTNENYSNNIELITPDNFSIDTTNKNNRSELKYYQAQKEFLDVQQKNLRSGYMPKISAFVQGGYGNPGLNMLKEEWSLYYMLGLRLNWNISKVYTNGNDKNLISINRNIIDMNKENFLFNSNIKAAREDAEIETMSKQLEDDDKIIAIREEITKSSEVKMKNGTMSVSDVLKEINNENLAKQNKAIREIQLLQKEFELKNTLNN